MTTPNSGNSFANLLRVALITLASAMLSVWAVNLIPTTSIGPNTKGLVLPGLIVLGILIFVFLYRLTSPALPPSHDQIPPADEPSD